jgi:SAM-dependent methyltransferase
VGLNDPRLVASEYEDERRLAVRRRVWNDFLEGPSSEDETLAAVVEATPSTVLEVGAGWGELSARIAAATGADVTALDLSPRMAALARQRGVRAFVGDLQALPFADRTFDVVVANAMLYHVPDLERGLREAARVLTDGGRLVATTFGEHHTAEIWRMVGGPQAELAFSAENGVAILERWFERVERREGGGVLTFPNADEVRTYIASTITRSRFAERVPDVEGPIVTRAHFAVFVAERPRRDAA